MAYTIIFQFIRNIKRVFKLTKGKFNDSHMLDHMSGDYLSLIVIIIEMITSL